MGLVKFFLVLFAFAFLFTSVPGAVFAEGIKVGVILPLTGKLSMYGEIEHRSFLMALDEINAAGGINGEKIDLVIEDTAGKCNKGLSAIEKLISKDRVVVIGGGFTSTVVWAAAAMAQERGVPFLINTASADKITEKGWNYIFRLNPPVSEHHRALTSFLKRVARVSTAAVIYENTHFGKFWSKKFVKQCEKSRIRAIIKEGYSPGAVDFSPLLFKVKSREPDIVFMASHVMDAALLVQQAKETGLNPGLFLGNPVGFARPEFRENAGNFSEYVYSPTLWAPSVPYLGAMKYYDKFMVKYDVPADYHGAQAYAGMYVIADALKRSRSLTPEDVRNALAETDMMTVFGPVKFVSYGKKTQQNRLPTYLVQWINGRLETVWPKKSASAKYIYPAPE